jgi:hypothetical protein
VSAPIGGLSPREVYVFRLVVRNASALIFGPAQMFATGKKMAAWGDSSYALNSVPNGLTQAVAVALVITHNFWELS